MLQTCQGGYRNAGFFREPQSTPAEFGTLLFYPFANCHVGPPPELSRLAKQFGLDELLGHSLPQIQAIAKP